MKLALSGIGGGCPAGRAVSALYAGHDRLLCRIARIRDLVADGAACRDLVADARLVGPYPPYLPAMAGSCVG